MPENFENSNNNFNQKPVASSLNNSNTKPPGRKNSGLWSKIKTLFTLLVLFVFIIAGFIIYVMVNPYSNFAGFTQKYLGFNYVIAPRSQPQTKTDAPAETPNNQPDSTSKNNILNQFLGLDTKINDKTSEFSKNAISPSSTETVIEKVLPSVISISVEPAGVSGTGFFVSEEGLIITNKHVISSICTNKKLENIILGTDYKNKSYELNLISVDPATDLAILRVKDGGNAKFAKVAFYPSGELKLGSDVIAIGNALSELKNTVTSGIISGLGRNIVGPEPDGCGGYTAFNQGLVQTDAAINKGNSGGPLFNKNGDLVGVNTFNGPNAQSIGLAIPADEVSKTLNSYLKYGKISKPYLGIVTRSVTDAYKIRNPGVPVNYGAIIDGDPVTGGLSDVQTPGQKAGLVSGDIILAINNEEIREPNNVSRVVSKFEPGDKITLKVLKNKSIITKTDDGKIIQKMEYETDPKEIEVVLGSLDSPI